MSSPSNLAAKAATIVNDQTGLERFGLATLVIGEAQWSVDFEQQGGTPFTNDPEGATYTIRFNDGRAGRVQWSRGTIGSNRVWTMLGMGPEPVKT